MDLSAVNRSEIARRTGMTVGGVSRILSGARNPSIASAKKISNALDISVDDLLASIGKKSTPPPTSSESVTLPAEDDTE